MLIGIVQVLRRQLVYNTMVSSLVTLTQCLLLLPPLLHMIIITRISYWDFLPSPNKLASSSMQLSQVLCILLVYQGCWITLNNQTSAVSQVTRGRHVGQLVLRKWHRRDLSSHHIKSSIFRTALAPLPIAIISIQISNK